MNINPVITVRYPRLWMFASRHTFKLAARVFALGAWLFERACKGAEVVEPDPIAKEPWELVALYVLFVIFICVLCLSAP